MRRKAEGIPRKGRSMKSQKQGWVETDNTGGTSTNQTGDQLLNPAVSDNIVIE